MTGSNVLEEDYSRRCRPPAGLSAQVKRRTGILIERINIGGGFGVPYRPNALLIWTRWRAASQVFDRRCGSSFRSPS